MSTEELEIEAESVEEAEKELSESQDREKALAADLRAHCERLDELQTEINKQSREQIENELAVERLRSELTLQTQRGENAAENLREAEETVKRLRSYTHLPSRSLTEFICLN